MNLQLIEKQVITPPHADYLAVHSIFNTIQGEGPFSGQPSIFVRLAGCNLQCPGCDTDYTTKRDVWDVASLLRELNERRYANIVEAPRGGWTDLVVITGGEPFRQPRGLCELILTLIENDFRVQVETNGTLGPLDAYMDRLLDLTTMGRLTIVCSPKTGAVNKRTQELLKCGLSSYKYVMSADSVDESDGLPVLALGHPGARVARPQGHRACDVYLQPYDAQDPVENKRHLDAVLRSCMRFGYRVCLQTHKIIGME